MYELFVREMGLWFGPICGRQFETLDRALGFLRQENRDAYKWGMYRVYLVTEGGRELVDGQE